MTQLETRWPCPVCLGVKLEKLQAGAAPHVVLDHCPRCGGIWFERGEVQRLRSLQQDTFWPHVKAPATTALSQCHGCHTPVGRDVDRCPACGEKTRLRCPVCERRMNVVERDGVLLDVCTDCHGVWFDHHEIAAIWRMERDAAVRRRQAYAQRGAGADGPTDLAAYALVDSLIYAPDLLFLGAHAAGRAVAASAEAAGTAPEALGAAAEVAAEAAEGVFSTILEIIGGIFG